MTYSFIICDELKAKMRGLRFDENAEYHACLLPLGSISWPDEYPDGRPFIRCHEECRESLLRLAAARAAYWDTEQIPPEYDHLWEEAREVIPDWPGFKRLYLSEKQRQAVDQCEQQALEFFEAMTSGAESVAIEEKDGLLRFSATFDLEKQPKSQE